MEWLAGDKTKVSGTFPPRRREWSGYVEKDTAGQTNIYSVEVGYSFLSYNSMLSLFHLTLLEVVDSPTFLAYVLSHI